MLVQRCEPIPYPTNPSALDTVGHETPLQLGTYHLHHRWAVSPSGLKESQWKDRN